MLHFAHNKVKLKIMEIKINVMDTFFCSVARSLAHSLVLSTSSSGEFVSEDALLRCLVNYIVKGNKLQMVFVAAEKKTTLRNFSSMIA